MAKEDRGFASMDRTKQREIASKGGKAAHLKGTAHEWSRDESREAGRKGGMAATEDLNRRSRRTERLTIKTSQSRRDAASGLAVRLLVINAVRGVASGDVTWSSASDAAASALIWASVPS